jgi:MSHA biogenesis protein MshJ
MMAGLRKSLGPLGERIDALTLRERGTMFVTLLVLLYFLASSFVFSPLQKQQLRLENEIKLKYEQISTVSAQTQNIIHAGTRDPDKENEIRLKQLRDQIGLVDPRLAGVSQSLVSPRDMARFVEQVMTRNRALQVIRVESRPPAAVEPAAAGTSAAAKGVYKHGMRIEVRGRYTDIVKYLRALESMPWKVFWGQVTLESEDYPLSRVTLVIYTLSVYQSWIGL